jgi:hypothetical protein
MQKDQHSTALHCGAERETAMHIMFTHLLQCMVHGFEHRFDNIYYDPEIEHLLNDTELYIE